MPSTRLRPDPDAMALNDHLAVAIAFRELPKRRWDVGIGMEDLDRPEKAFHELRPEIPILRKDERSEAGFLDGDGETGLVVVRHFGGLSVLDEHQARIH